MRNKKLFLIAILFAFCVQMLSACSKKEPVKEYVPGNEVGSYYSDYNDSVSYLNLKDDASFSVTFKNDASFSVTFKNDALTGTYELENNALTFSYGELSIEAVYKDETVTFTYEGVNLSYIRNVDYTVSYNTNGGSAVESSTVVNGQFANEPATPTKTDYQFLGWYSDEKFTKKYDFSTVVTSDFTLYARWAYAKGVSSEYTISFDLGYEETYNDIVTIGGLLYDVKDPTRDGYKFLGWWFSQYDDKDKLSYKYNNDKFLASTTLYALWQSTDSQGQKLSNPQVNVLDNKLVWDNILGASSYKVLITLDEQVVYEQTLTSSTCDFDFSNYAAGDYVISVQAKAASEANSSDEVVRYYKNKALTQVSNFNVVDGHLLVFNAVKDATNYKVTVSCGNKLHDHSIIVDNGMETVYDFSSCKMQEGGITFVVTASAKGYASSVSKTYVFDRVLDEVEEFMFDEDTEMLSWKPVLNATSYTVTITDGVDTYVLKLGNNTNVCLKEYEMATDGIVVSVVAKCNGFNSPEGSEYVYNKDNLATPRNLVVSNAVITWDEVSNAESYEVVINGKSYTSPTNSLEFPVDLDLAELGPISIKVRAIGSKDSSYTDELLLVNSLEGELLYNNGRVYWPSVITADNFEVRVNGSKETTVVDATEKFSDVKLTKKGINTIEVRYIVISSAGYFRSEWASIEVYAYQVTFNGNGGLVTFDEAMFAEYFSDDNEDVVLNEVESIYVAVGDYFKFPYSYASGYDPAGWYLTKDPTGFNEEYLNDRFIGTTDLYLYQAYTPKTYTITYVVKNGTVENATFDVKYNSNYTLDIPVSNNEYIFDGWFESDNSRGIKFTNSRGESLFKYDRPNDITLYAGWSFFEFTLIENGKEYSVKKGDSAKFITDLVIPAYYNDIPVTTIDSYAFGFLDNLITVTLPNTLTTIHYSAFSSCDNIKEYIVSEDLKPEQEPRYSSQDGAVIDNDPTTGEVVISLLPLSTSGVYIIPENITNVLGNTFYHHDLITEIVIPTSVEKIWEKAFSYCEKLETVTFLNDNLTDESEIIISDDSFYSCKELLTIKLPDHYKTFSCDIIFSCNEATTFEFSDTNPYYKSINGLIYDPKVTKLVYHPDIEWKEPLPTTVTTIGAYAFADNDNLNSVTIPVHINTIEEYAFYDCDSLTTVTFAGGGTEGLDYLTIGKCAFKDANLLLNIIFEDGSYVTEIGEEAFSGQLDIVTFTLPDTVKVIGNKAFSKLYPLKEFIISENSQLESLGELVFSGCNKLESLYIPKNLISVSDDTYGGCDGLITIDVHPENKAFTSENGILYDKEITKILFYSKAKTGPFILPDTILEIGNSAFEGHEGITSITIHGGVTKIGNNAFDGCKYLKEIIFTEDNNTSDVELTIGDSAFKNCDDIKSFIMPDRVTKVGKELFMYCEDIENVTLSKNLEAISESMFYYNNLQTITIPASVKTIGEDAFKYCDITEITFASGSQLELIGENAFWSSKIKTITIPANVYMIDDSCFEYCNYLEEVLFEDSEVDLELGEYLFNSCDSIKLFTVPARTISIKSKAFACYTLDSHYGGVAETSLEEIIFEEGCNVTELNAYLFQYSNKLTKITLHEGLQTIKTNAFSSSYVTSIVVPASVTLIAKQAFYTASKLTEITFAENSTLKTIQDNAFESCYNLLSIALPSSIETIGSTIFSNCTKLTDVNMAAGGEYYSIENGALYKVEEGVSTELVLVSPGVTGTLTVKNTVKKIGNKAFFASSLSEVIFESGDTALEFGSGNTYMFQSSTVERVDLGNRFETIPNGMFASSNLQEIVIPKEVTSIEDNAFNYSKLAKITFEEESMLSSINYYSFRFTNITTIDIPANVNLIDNSAFEDCQWLETVNFAEGSVLATIGNSAFEDCYKLSGIVLPDTVSSIGSEAFFNNHSLTSFRIPASVKELDTTSFAGCELIDKITVHKDNTNFLDVDGVIYSIDKTELIYYPLGKVGDYVVPNTVTSIAEGAFYQNKNLGVVSFEEGGTEDLVIGKDTTSYSYKGVFAYSSLSSIVLPDNLTILGYKTFQHCENLTLVDISACDQLEKICGYTFNNVAITEITIPENVTKIDKNAFQDSLNLVTVNFASDEKLNEIGMYAFDGCEILSNMQLPNSITTLGSYAFQSTGALEITIPEKIKTWPTYLFSYSKITSVVIPDGLKTIGNYAFYQCTDLAEVTMGADITTIGTYAFQECKSLKEIFIPLGVTLLNSKLFYHCESLEKVELNNVTKINASAFEGCSSLTDVTLPSGLLTLGGSAFFGCESLKEIEVPSTITSTSYAVFKNCTSLEKVVINGTYTKLSTSWFYGCESLVDVTLPSTLTKIEALFFYGCSSLKEIDVPSSVTIIDSSAFAYCESLETVNLPMTISTLGSSSFAGCTSLKNIYLPTTLTQISNTTFKNCINLTNLTIDKDNTTYKMVDGVVFSYSGKSIVLATPNVTGNYEIPEGVAYIWAYAFANSKITGITLPEGLESLGDYAFVNCQNLESVIIPSTITSYMDSDDESIGFNDYVFKDCTNLKTVEFTDGDDLLTIGENAFEGCISLESITFPKRLGTFTTDEKYFTVYNAIEDEAFKGCINLETITFASEGLYSINIGESAFSGCSKLNNVVLPDNLFTTISNYSYEDYASKSLGENAFKDCISLTNITIPNGKNIITLGDSVFAGCTSLVEITLPNSIKDFYNAVELETAVGFGANMFNGCTSLTTVNVGSGISNLSSSTFSGCNKLENINIDSDNPNFEYTDGELYNADKSQMLFYSPVCTKADVVIPNTVTGVPNGIFEGNTHIKTITISDRMAKIDADTFGFVPNLEKYILNDTNICFKVVNGVLYDYEMTTLISYLPTLTAKSFEVPEGVTKIEEFAFRYNPYLESVSLPSTLKTVTYGLAWVPNLAEIKLSEDNTSFVVKDGGLYSNTMLYLYQYAVGRTDKEFVLEDGCKYVKEFAFAGNKSIEKVVINDDFYCSSYFTNTSGGGFGYMYGVKEFVVSKNNTSFVSIDGVVYTANLEVLVFYPAAKEGTTYTALDTVEKVANGSFAFAKNLEEVYFVSDLTYIYKGAFMGWTSDQTIYLTKDSSIVSNFNDLYDGTCEATVVLGDN